MYYSQMKKEELSALLSELNAEYGAVKAKGLKLDMSRGKPEASQLSISEELLRTLSTDKDCYAENGFDCRNYGVLDGIPEAKRMFAELLALSEDELFIGGNSSLNLMYDSVARAMLYGVCDSDRPWCREEKIKFLCRKGTLFSIHPDTSGRLIDFNAPYFDDIVFLHVAVHQTLITCHMGLYARHKLAWAKGLGHIIIGSQSQTSDLVNIVFLCRDHDDRCILFLADLAADFKSIQSRQHQIQDDQIKLFRKRSLQSTISRMFNLHIKSGEFQIIFLKICNSYFIFYD